MTTSSIPKSFISSLLAQCDIVTLISYFIPLRKEGTSYTTHCPFHEESTASFKVSTAKQLYHCFGCKAGGNAINFVMTYEKLDFVAAIEWLASHLQIKMPTRTGSRSASGDSVQLLYKVLQDTADFYHAQLLKSSTALEYLKERGLTQSSIQQFQLGFSPVNWDSLLKFLTHQKKHQLSTIKAAGLITQKRPPHYYDRFRGRIIFPIRDRQGRCIGLGGRVLEKEGMPKYLNSPETSLFHKNQALYGLYETLNHRETIKRFWIVEGYLDVIMLHQFGIKEAVATLGTAMSRFHLQQLFRLSEEVVFCFDGDVAGKKAAIRALELCLPLLQDSWTIRFLILPEGEDPDSWIQKSTHTTQHNLLQQAITLEDFFFTLIQKNVSLHTMEGQRALLEKAASLLKRLPKGIRREQILGRLARLVNISPDKLHRLLLQPRHFVPKTLDKKENHTVLERTVGLLLQYPHILARCLTKPLDNPLKDEHPLLDIVIKKIQADPTIQTATLLEQFRDHPDLFQRLTTLAQHNWLIPSEGVVEEFQDILIYLNKSSKSKKIKLLLERAREKIITLEEKKQLNQLLNERSSN